MGNINNDATISKLTCYHCGDDCANSKIMVADKSFCCSGCKMVYEILNQNNLCEYYALNNNPGNAQNKSIRANKYAFLDNAAIIQKLIQFSDGKQTQVVFYLPQIHCSSCLWLLENLHQLNAGIISSRVNFPRKEVFVVFNNKSTLRQVVETLEKIGYEPHLSLQDVDVPQASSFNKKRILKIGIAGFCFSNIMMMSFPDYFSIGGFLEKEIGIALKYFIVILSFPVLFYCATDFFVAAWKGLKNKFVNIDAPIALAVLITFLRSMYEIFSATGSGYLDSMSGIVFFMLVGRYLQEKTQQSLTFNRDYKSFFPIAVDVIRDNEIIPTQINHIKVNDVVRIYADELVPMDGILSKGKACIDYSFVSGESLPVDKEIGEMVYAGGKQTKSVIELIAVKEVSQSYLTGLWNKDAFKPDKKNEQSFIHKISNYFTIFLFVTGLASAAYWYSQHQPLLMWNAVTTILIVACPCALLLSATFTNGNVLRILNRNKLYLKNADIIEQMGRVNHIVFDKTGTITERNSQSIQYSGKPLSKYQENIIKVLLVQSNHPLGNAVRQHLENKQAGKNYFNPFEVQGLLNSYKIQTGKGIEAWVNDSHVKIGSAKFVQANEETDNKASEVYIKFDNDIYGKYIIANKYRKGFSALMNSLKNRHRVSVLSGDNNAEKKYLQQSIGENNSILFNQSPTDKLDFIQKEQQEKQCKIMMVGDGLNDAGALQQSNVGIAITEGYNNFTPASDGILNAESLHKLPQFLAMAKSGKIIIIVSFIISIIYNIIGLSFAVQGRLSPLIAAILMPASSISIILITYGLSSLRAAQLKL